jgi:hypothetical protein
MKARKNPTARDGRVLEILSWEAKVSLSQPLATVQAKFLASRFGLAPNLANVVATLAFHNNGEAA